ncbi:MAG: hypothetical protein KGZ97_00850 [Bacteroidetes bacterium]|nr:hypothetical protein [Bacteroidota bacterium]
MKKLLYIITAITFITLSCDKDNVESDTGTGGSMARFTIKDNYLYTVDYENLHSFNISNPADIVHENKQYLGFGIETIFPTEDYLFIGANNGMYIYSLEEPSSPVRKSFTAHFVARDPVVVQGNYAYATIRSNPDFTWAEANQLLIFDISNVIVPELVIQYQMVNPRGLGIDGETLFVCDNVLKVYTVTNGYEIELKHTFDIQAIDVIPKNGRLYVLTENGIYQYDYDGENITLISSLTTNS